MHGHAHKHDDDDPASDWPPPESIPLAVEDLEKAQPCIPPTKRIKGGKEIFIFRHSSAFHRLWDFIGRLNSSVTGKPISTQCPVSDALLKLVGALGEIESWIDSIPRVEKPTRFGDKTFRDKFLPAVQERSVAFVQQVAPPSSQRWVPEAAHYLCHSFGDAQRIDYGTGHELNFVCFLVCLERMGVFGIEDYEAVVLRVFVRYLQVMRRLQVEYRLEPAGSRGVWGLDDFHFLPFLWGAAQLIGHKHIKPKSAKTPDVVDSFAGEYLYLSCMQFINRVKPCSLAEHSPMLNDITNVATWEKVNSGLFKMYKAEVLFKPAVVQHFFFGALLPFERAPLAAPVDPADLETIKSASRREAPCCSNAIRFPSAVSAGPLGGPPLASASASGPAERGPRAPETGSLAAPRAQAGPPAVHPASAPGAREPGYVAPHDESAAPHAPAASATPQGKEKVPDAEPGLVKSRGDEQQPRAGSLSELRRRKYDGPGPRGPGSVSPRRRGSPTEGRRGGSSRSPDRGGVQAVMPGDVQRRQGHAPGPAPDLAALEEERSPMDE